MPDLYTAKNSAQGTGNSAQENEGNPGVHDLPGHSHNPLSAYCYLPDGVHFETQEPNEKILLLLRRHHITNVPWILVTLLLVFVPGFILPNFPLLDFLPARFQLMAGVFYYLIVTAYVLESALSWYFTVNIVTNERIIDVDFINLIYREVSDARLDKIQDVTDNMGGVIGTLFNFGDVILQTAGAEVDVEFDNIPNPGQVHKLLDELTSKGPEGL